MPAQQPAVPSRKAAFPLSAAEKKLLLAGTLTQYETLANLVREAPAAEPVWLSVDELELLLDCLDDDFDLCTSPAQRKKIDALSKKGDSLFNDLLCVAPGDPLDEIVTLCEQELESNSSELMQAGLAIDLFVDMAGLKRKSLGPFELSPKQIQLLRSLPIGSKTLQKKFAQSSPSFTIGQTIDLLRALVLNLPDSSTMKEVDQVLLAKLLLERLQSAVARIAPQWDREREGPPQPTDNLYQFKITLQGVEPPIWRQIQVPDCTLNDLHGYIQAALGWENCHLYEFTIRGERYSCAPHADGPNFGDDSGDCAAVLLSDLLPWAKRRLTFEYLYDFGDSWVHEVQFEGCPKAEPRVKYPRCVAGARACPPEDCGGSWGYHRLLEALQNPGEDDGEELLEIYGRSFDPERFNAQRVSQALRR